MTDADTLTPAPEPEPQVLTSESGPESPPDADSSSSPQATQAPEDEVARYKAAAKGSADEWRKEKERRERLEMELNQLRYQQQQQWQQQQQQPPPKPPEQSYEELAEQLNKATWDNDKATQAKILKQMHERSVAEAEERTLNKFGQLAQQAQQQSSFNTYMASLGIKPNSAEGAKVAQMAQELSRDPSYYWAAGNQMYLLGIAAERVKGEIGTERKVAETVVRRDTAASGSTEGASRGTGLPPGKTASEERVYLTDAEKHVAHRTYDNLSREAAEKRYWNGLYPHIREARKQAGKAI